MNLSFKRNGFKVMKNYSAEVMDELEIKKSVIICFRKLYDKVNLVMDKFNETLSDKKVEASVLQVHIVWCSHLKKDKKIDASQIYDLSNHTKVPNLKRIIEKYSKISLFYGRFSVLVVLVTQ